MFYLRHFYSCLVVFFSFSSCFSVDFTELRAQRDELLAQRDSISADQYYSKLYDFFRQIDSLICEYIVNNRVADKNHFANTSNVVELATKETQKRFIPSGAQSALKRYSIEVCQIGGGEVSNGDVFMGIIASLYENNSMSDIGIVNKSSIQKAHLNAPNEVQKKAKVILITWDSLFPNATHVLFFNPYVKASWNNLKAAISHEMAHLTQNHDEIDRDIRRWMEIDADLKSLCKRNERGEWVLRKKFKIHIQDFFEGIRWRRECELKAIGFLCQGLSKEDANQMKSHLDKLYFMKDDSFYPYPNARKEIMEYFVSVINKVGGTVTDDEINAISLGITQTYYAGVKCKFSKGFLEKAALAKKRLQKNPKFKKLFPLNSSRGLAGNIIGYARDAVHFIYDTIGNAR